MDSFKVYAYEEVPSVIDGLPVIQKVEKAVECLTQHKMPIARFEFGDSMMPILRSGQFCKISPIQDINDIKTGDALFCEVNGYVGTHIVLVRSDIDPKNPWFLIGMTDMQPIGWTNNVFGIATAINHIVKPAVSVAALGRGRFFG